MSLIHKDDHCEVHAYSMFDTLPGLVIVAINLEGNKMKPIKRSPDAVVYPLSDGMVVTLTKHGIIKLREGRTIELDMLSGGKQVKFLLMRDSAWEIKKKQLAKEKQN